ncbi:lysine N(6)-hydroxylase/L-ornithine N(5)-oxygenase family protein [Lolliginicoccus levis]|uniref:lysine N(6)-hydroxylase/L-ornithine N(5)-oxygenase family protein n=1 Tax=Lolliginicoccus levis TaxID=2919542 RepID=UPI00241DBD58|nr:lysine N(6)-hydroxylase/L-ornithine N(5)-oxygenase family protein [Lolliginicoccus levis]
MTASASTIGHGAEHVHDVIGIGFGPSNLALAIALEEHNADAESAPLSAVFLEKQDRFGWHRGMLLDGTTMQIAFPKDLVTFRNPRSPYTFLSYLHAQGRLVDFVNHQTFFPTRHEFHDYLEWAADNVSADVRYSTTVTSIEPDPDTDGIARRFIVTTSTGATFRAHNVVVAVGLREKHPEWATASSRCFHNHRFLEHVAAMPEPTNQRFAVIGAGQSAAEIVDYLHANFPGAEVHNVFSRFGYSPADDSPYANRIFDPSAVDEFHGAPAEARQRLLEIHRSTNYAVVDLELINKLYAAEYQERVRGPRRLFMRRGSHVTGIEEHASGIDVQVRSELTGEEERLACDAVVLATGFAPAPLAPILGDIVPADPRDRQISRDYRAVTAPTIQGGIYFQGGVEHSHGLTSSLLSNVAVRSGDILRSIVRNRAVTVPGWMQQAPERASA